MALETFAIVSCGDRCIDVVEFQRWLSKGWKETKLQFESDTRSPASPSASDRRQVD